MFLRRKQNPLSIDLIDARLVKVEDRLDRLVRYAAWQKSRERQGAASRCGSIECALAKLARSGGFTFDQDAG